MNIAFLIPSMLSGGAERAISILCNEFSKMGNQVSLLLTEDAKHIYYKLDENVRVIDIVDNRMPYYIRIPNYIRNIKKHLAEKKIDVLVSFIVRTNVLAIISCKSSGIPVIVSERNNPYLVPASYSWRKIRDFSYKFADGIVFQTGHAQHYFCSSIRKSSTIIMNPITDDIIGDSTSDNRDNIIIMACRLEDQKNVRMLINAFSLIYKDIPNYKVLVYGEGSQRTMLQNLIDKLGLHDVILLKGRSEQIIREISKAKIFALTSRYEGLSNAVMEAMCVGTPCVVTDSPTFGNRDLIDNGINGFIVPLENEEEMAKKILLLAKDDNLRESFSVQAKKLYKKVNSKYIAKKWYDYINEVIKK